MKIELLAGVGQRGVHLLVNRVHVRVERLYDLELMVVRAHNARIGGELRRRHLLQFGVVLKVL